MDQTAPARTCPRCARPLADSTGPLSECVCTSCAGRFLEPAGVERLVHQELGYDVGFLRELAGHFAGQPLTCPQCHSKMSPLRLRGEAVDLCMGCGGLWLDPGELSGVSAGRHDEPIAPRPRLPPPIPPEDLFERTADFETEVAKIRAGMWQTPGMGLEPEKRKLEPVPWLALAAGLFLIGAGILVFVQGERMRKVECEWESGQRTCTFFHKTIWGDEVRTLGALQTSIDDRPGNNRTVRGLAVLESDGQTIIEEQLPSRKAAKMKIALLEKPRPDGASLTFVRDYSWWRFVAAVFGVLIGLMMFAGALGQYLPNDDDMTRSHDYRIR